jgi:hypothetical protein
LSSYFHSCKGLYNATIYANDSFGKVNSQFFGWDYDVFENNRTFNPSPATTTRETFTLNITTPTSEIPIAYLVYNGTEYLATRTPTGASTNHLFARNLTLNNAGNFSFYWRVTYGEVNVSTYTSNQTVSAVSSAVIQEGDCPAGLTQTMFFTFANEQNLTALEDVNLKYNLKYGISDPEGASYYGTLTNISDASLCMNLTQSPTYQIGYGELEYKKTGYTTRRYYIFDNTRLSNTTSNTTLYSLPVTSATSFLTEIRSPTLQPYIGKYISLLRWYPTLNEYKVVEMGKTDDKGQSVVRVKIEDVDYRIGVYETDGSLIHLANPIRMICLTSPCSYTINVPSKSTNKFDEVQGIEAEITYLDGIFRLVYNDPSQNTDVMSLRVHKIDGDLICDSNSTAFTGVLTCNVSAYSGTLKAVAIRTASPENPIASLIINTLTSPFTGTFGLFLQFLIIVTLVFLGIISPVISIIMGIGALIIGTVLFKTAGVSSYHMLISVATLGGIVIYFLRKNAGQN